MKASSSQGFKSLLHGTKPKQSWECPGEIFREALVTLDSETFSQCAQSWKIFQFGLGLEVTLRGHATARLQWLGARSVETCQAKSAMCVENGFAAILEVATFAVSMGAFLLPWALAILCVLTAGYVIGKLACSMFILVLSVARLVRACGAMNTETHVRTA